MIKVIPNFKKYTIDAKGVIRSIKRNNILKIRISQGGYPAVALTRDDGIRTTQYVHRLLAEIFIENPNNLPQVNHKDGDKLNFSLSNLEWVSCAENILHAYSTGLHVKAKSTESPNTDLTEEDIRSVCEKIVEGWRLKDISSSLGISYSTVRNIKQKTCFLNIVESYDFSLVKRSSSLSIKTVLWVAGKLEEGLMPKDIISLAENPKLKLHHVRDILARRSFTKITENFLF